MSTFEPKRSVLPAAQLALWNRLTPSVGLGFVLYGGTAIALRLGHRVSIDFDFFSSRPLDKSALYGALPFLEGAVVLQDQANTHTVMAATDVPDATHVKLSFFGNLTFGRIGAPTQTADGALLVASLDDLMATKLKVLLQRVEAKDYLDIAALLRAGVSLSRGLAGARALFGPQFQPSESLRALVYFEGGDLATLDTGVREALIAATSAIRELPEVVPASRHELT